MRAAAEFQRRVPTSSNDDGGGGGDGDSGGLVWLGWLLVALVCRLLGRGFVDLLVVGCLVVGLLVCWFIGLLIPCFAGFLDNASRGG